MEETFIKRVRKLLCFIIFVALVFSLCSCNNYKLSYKKPQNYSVYRFALKVGESKEFDFDEIFANCSVKADRIEINNSSKIYSVKGNIPLLPRIRVSSMCRQSSITTKP